MGSGFNIKLGMIQHDVHALIDCASKKYAVGDYI